MRRFEGRMSLAGGGGLRNVETPGPMREQTIRVLEETPLKVKAHIDGRVPYHVEVGLVELRQRFRGRRVLAVLSGVSWAGESIASYLNALAFSDVTIIADDGTASGCQIANALLDLGCAVHVVFNEADVDGCLKSLERMADVLVWIGMDESESR